jgi:peptidoglycan-associated lipoprotein
MHGNHGRSYRAVPGARDSVARVDAARNTLRQPIYFDYDQDAIRPDAQSVLESKLPLLRANPALRLRIAGHTDDRGSDEYNLALGQRRAASARRFLELRGVDPSRIDIVSFGEERPASASQTESAWASNRRDEFEIVAGGDNLIVPGS